MTLTKYTPSQEFETRLRERTGYSLSNPHIRQPIHNSIADRINAIQQGRDGRSSALLAARSGLGDRSRHLVLALTASVCGLFQNVRYATARGHHLHEIPTDHRAIMPEVQTEAIPSAQPIAETTAPNHWEMHFRQLGEYLAQVDWSQPSITLGLGASLFLAQIIALSQRRNIKQSLCAIDTKLGVNACDSVLMLGHSEIGPAISSAKDALKGDENTDVLVNKTGALNDVAQAELALETDIKQNNTQTEDLEIPEVADAKEFAIFADTEIMKPQVQWEHDAASRKGKIREENQDHFAAVEFEPGLKVMVVCDGAGGIKGGREAAHSAVEAIHQSLIKSFAEKTTLESVDLVKAINDARGVAGANDLNGITTALLVLLKGDQVIYATLGDGAVAIVWPDGMVSQLLVPHHTAGQPSNIINAYIGRGCDVAPRTGSVCLENKCVVMAMTDGVSDLFPFDDFALKRGEYGETQGLSDLFLEQIEAARDPDTGAYLHHDNMTLALARLAKGDGHE